MNIHFYNFKPCIMQATVAGSCQILDQLILLPKYDLHCTISTHNKYLLGR